MEIQPIQFVTAFISLISLIFVLLNVRRERVGHNPRPATGVRPASRRLRRLVGLTTMVEGYDNGVVCLSGFDTAAATSATIQLWNPIRNQLRQLPPPPAAAADSGRRNIGFRLGVGRDPSTDDLKVVRVCSPTHHNPSVHHVNLFVACTEVSVYSLRENSWRVIEWAPLIDPASPDCTVEFTSCNRRRSVVVNHCVHWSARFELSRPGQSGLISKFGIVAFDLATEAFRMINLPRAMNQIAVKDCLAKLFGHLALVVRAEGLADIWVMKRYDDANSWAKHVSLNLNTILNLPVLIQPFRVSKIEMTSDGLAMIFTNRDTIFYDLKRKTVQQFCQLAKVDRGHIFDGVAPSKATCLFPKKMAQSPNTMLTNIVCVR